MVLRILTWWLLLPFAVGMLVKWLLNLFFMAPLSHEAGETGEFEDDPLWTLEGRTRRTLRLARELVSADAIKPSEGLCGVVGCCFRCAVAQARTAIDAEDGVTSWTESDDVQLLATTRVKSVLTDRGRPNPPHSQAEVLQAIDAALNEPEEAVT